MLLNDDDLTYCKARLDPASLSTAIDGIADVAESLPRTLLWSAVWEMTRDALMRARDFVTLAVRGVATEDQIGVLQRVLAQLQVAVGVLRRAGLGRRRPAGRRCPRPCTTWRSARAAAATPSSPRCRPSPARKLRRRRSSTEIAGWRDGSAPLAGLTVDTDLSWTLLGALVAHGAAGDAEIDAAAAADSTASGRAGPPRCARCGPTPTNKAAVWERLINDDGMANALQDAAIAGFAHPAQAELLAPYVDKYFEDVAGVWERRSIEVAQKVAVGLYPRWAVDQRTVDLAVGMGRAGASAGAAPAGLRGPGRHRTRPARPRRGRRG